MRLLASMLLIAFFILLIIFSIGSWSCNQPPKPSGETQQTENANKKDCATFYGTFEVGLFDTGRFIHAYHQETVAVATVIIAAFTIILGVFTISLARSTRVAAEHIPLVERAYLFGGPDTRTLTVRDDLNLIQFKFGVKNNGKTPGIVAEIWVEFLTDEPTSGNPIYRRGQAGVNGRLAEPDAVLSAGDDASSLFPPPFSCTPGERYFAGYIIYTDIFKKTHTSRFCTRFDFDNRSWHRVGPPAWNDWD
jgi:hypothetical protein